MPTILEEILAQKLHGLTLSDPAMWAQKCRVMGKPFPGPYNTEPFFPWNKEIMCYNGPYLVVKKGAQTGVSEAMINRALFTLDQLKLNVFYALPTTSPDAQDFSTARFGKAIELSEYIKNMFVSTDRVGLKQTAENTLYIRGVQTKNQLRSTDCALLVADEVDVFPPWVIPLFKHRSKGQLEKYFRALSTPSLPGYGIDLMFKTTTQEHFFFPCPHCSRHIELRFPDSLVITGDKHNDPNVKNSHLICYECKGVLKHEEKPLWLPKGFYVPKYPDSSERGLYVNQLYSSTAQPFEAAEDYLRGLDDRFYEQEFHNSVMGNAHVVEGASVNDQDLINCTGDYHMADILKINDPTRIRTCGIDVGAKIHYVVKSYKMYSNTSTIVNENAKCEYLAIGTVDSFAEMARILQRFRPQSFVVDAMPETQLAKSFVAQYGKLGRICYYNANMKERALGLSAENEISVSVNRSNWLDLTMGRFKDGTTSLPKDCPYDFKEHIKATVRHYKIDGDKKMVIYRETGPDHYAHADNYAEIALGLTDDNYTPKNL